MKILAKKYIWNITPEVPRAGEGSAVLLQDGRIFLVYSRFLGGGADHSKAELLGGILSLQDGSLSEQRILFAAPEALNQMSVSLERLQDSSLGMVFIRKLTPNTDQIFFSRSTDEGQTWSEPVHCSQCCPQFPYLVVNNDRLRQFSNGRLAIPVNLYAHGGHTPENLEGASTGIIYSDDNGRTWQLSEHIIIEEENIIPPPVISPDNPEAWDWCLKHQFKQQEPGVEQLLDGSIYLYCRTVLGYMYHARSFDNGNTWTALKPCFDLPSPCGPQSIRRIPGQKRLLCVYNDHHGQAFAGENWNWRTPLTLAASDDDGHSWQTLGEVEDNRHNYCYTSMLFLDDKLLLTEYESENTEDGSRRNLANLKMQLITDFQAK